MNSIPIFLNRAELADELGLPRRVVFAANAKKRLPVAARLATGAPLFAASQLTELRQILTNKTPEVVSAK